MEKLDILIEDMACTIQRLTNEIDEPNDFGNTPEANYLAMLDKLQEWKKLRFTHEVLIHLRSTVKDNKEAKQCNTAIVSGSYYWVKLMTDDKHEPAIAINLRGVMNFQFYNGVAVPCDQVNDYSECNYR